MTDIPTVVAPKKRGGFTAEMRAKAAATRAANAEKAMIAAQKTKAVQQSDPLVGITRTACPNACKPGYCVISQEFYCAHPNKGSLHSHQMADRNALGRLDRAIDFIAKQG